MGIITDIKIDPIKKIFYALSVEQNQQQIEIYDIESKKKIGEI